MSQNISWDQDYSQKFVEEESYDKPEILDSGIYEFTITKLEKKTSKGAKYSGAPMAEISFNTGGCNLKSWIVLNVDFKSTIANFIRAIYGLEQPPQGFWDQVAGKNILLKVEKYQEEYEGKMYWKNKVQSYMAKDLEHKIGAFDTQPVEKKAAPAQSEPSIPPMNDNLPF